MKGEIDMKKVFMKAGNRTLSKRLFSIMLIIGILFSMMPDATYADNSGRPPDAIEQEDTEVTESEMSDNKAAEPEQGSEVKQNTESEQNSESDEMTQDESNYQDTQAQDVQTEDDESNHDNEVMATSNGQSAIMTHTGQTDYMMVSSKSGEYDRYSSDKPNYARLVKFIPSFTSVYYISSVVPYSFDTYGRLYDRNMSSLTSDDDSAGNGQFKLTYRCEAGKTYYIAAGGYTNSSDTRSLAVSIVPSIYAILYNTGELHFQYGETADPAKGSVVGTYQVASSYSAPYQIPWLQKNTSIVKVTSDYISCSVGGITSMSYWFESCRNLANVDVSKIDTSNVRNMSDMFSNCPKLTNLNLSNLNTSNVTNMSGMFDSCSNLTSLNLSSFNTSNVTNMNRMFAACSNLTSLDLSKFNTSNVTDMSGMFNYCLKLTSLDLSKFNTSKVTNMSYMFYCCLKLTILDVSSLDTSKVTDMSNMFRKCSNLKIINLRDKFSTESLKSCNNIFTDTTADLLCDGKKKNAFPAEAYDYGKYIVRGPEFVYTGSQIVENNLQSMVLKPYKKDVKFDANGGTGTITIHVGVNDAIFCNAKYWSRMNICNNLGSFNDGMGYSYPTKSFYTFMGFFTQDGKELLNVNLITEDVYYAHWTPTNYSISYNLNGGSLSGQKTSYNIETANFTLPTPSKSGYTFTGWTGSNGTTAQKSVTITKGSTGNRSYTANWTPTNYTISYNANGGSLSGQKTSYNIETANFTLPQPTRSGYTFTGWTGTGLSSATKSVTVSKGSTGNRSYTANWSANGYTVSFNYNKPSTATGTMSGNGTTSKGVTYATAYGTLPQPSIPGWAFNGWYTAASGGSGISATTTYTAVGNQTLYAHWTLNTYSISYNANGGSLSGQKTNYNVNTDSFTLPTPTKNGYTFTGWTGSNGTTAQKSVTIVKGSTGNKSYTAHWTPTKYTIGYTLNGGSISGQPTNYNIESANFTLPTPSKSGYTFTGWTGTGLSGLTKTVTVSKGSTGNRTYTAHFEKTVTATFKYYNNQTVTVTGKITDSATSVAVKAPAASGTPSGYTFRGWSTSSAANASVNAAASANVTISANVTYYASYSKNVTATFYYCALAADNYTYANGAQKSVTASATQYFGYTGTVVNSSISIPSTVTASHGGASAQNYVGVSKDTNSVSTVTPTTACTKYYAVYTEPLKFYYYNGTTDTSTSVTRRMLSNGSTYSNSLSTSAPTPAAYDGAAFAWWSYDSGVSGSSSLRKPLETGVNSLYAVYKKNVNISYNANGGSGAPAAQSGIKYYAKKESGSNIANPSITVTGSKPSRGGYNFSSWNTSANGNGTVYKAGAAYAISANVTLYAHWTPINWTIKYDANGGTGTMADTKHTYGANIKTTANAFTKTGYSFAYWNVSRVRNGKTEWLYANTDNSWISGASWYEKGKAPANLKLYNWPNTEYSSSTTYTNGDVITLHAQWTVNTLTIRYHNNGAQTYHDFNGNTLDVTKKDIIRTFSGKYNEDYDAVSGLLDVSRLTKTGYHSNGYWFVGSKNSSIKISDSKGYPKVQDIAKDAGVLDAFQKGNVTIDFYPDMLPNTYTLTFDYGKKTVTTTKSKTITYDSVYGPLPNPQCTGWTFKGWNTKADGSGNVVTEKTICKDLSNVTVYAQWSYSSVSVKVPQVLIGNHTGKSQFRVKCDNLKAGNIKITVPNSFPYKQTGKVDVTATITSKSGNNIITPSNKVCVYNITTTNGLSAGCWQGSFNIGLTLTKE